MEAIEHKNNKEANDDKPKNLLKSIKSSYIIRNIFSYFDKKKELDLIKYNIVKDWAIMMRGTFELKVDIEISF